MGIIRLRAWVMPALGAETVHILEEAFAPFYQTYPHIRVSWKLIPWNRAWREVSDAYKRKEPPDVFQIGSTWIGTLARLGYLQPPPPQLRQKAAIAPWVEQSVTYGDVPVAVPWVCDCPLFLARPDVLDRYGIAWEQLSTWESLLDVCQWISRQTVVEPGIDPYHPASIGFSCRPGQGTLHQVTPWFFSGGWEVGDLNQLPVQLLAHPSIDPALDMLHRLMRCNPAAHAAAYLHGHQLDRSFYQEGSFAFALSSWSTQIKHVLFGQAPLAGGDRYFPTTALKMPKGPGGSFVFGGGSALGVSAATWYEEESWAVVDYMTSDEFFRVWTRASGQPPALRGSFWQDDSAWDDEQRRFIDLLACTVQNACTFPVHGMWRSIEQALSDGVSRMLIALLDHEPKSEAVSRPAKEADARINAFLRFSWEWDHV